MSPAEIRLELVKALLPAASRHSVSDPTVIINTATALEKYVVESAAKVEDTPDSTAKRSPGRPRKEKSEPATPDFLTPPMVDKSNQAHG